MITQKKDVLPNGSNKKPITASLKSLKIGETEKFPLERIRSVASIIDSMKLTTELDFSTKRDNENKVLIVTRTR
jgi:hypothetical protein